MNLLRLRPPRSAVCGGKWLALAASIYIQCTSGSSYCFGVYSSLLKNSQAYYQSTLDSVPVLKDYYSVSLGFVLPSFEKVWPCFIFHRCWFAVDFSKIHCSSCYSSGIILLVGLVVDVGLMYDN